MIEYGGDHSAKKSIEKVHLEKYPFLKRPYFLSVSRAQSDNNLHMLLEAFEDLPEYTLCLISNWTVSDYGLKLWNKYKDKYKNIIALDAIYDQNELDVLRSNTSLYIHSHSFCGTAPSLVEAMNLELPIICFNAETNVETTENKSFYFKTAEELKSLIRSLSNKDLKILDLI